MPTRIAPELPTLVGVHGPEWIRGMALDATRTGFRRRMGLYSRRGLDWTHRFPSIAAALEKLGSGNVILDGEIVVLEPDGTSDFQALQNVMGGNDNAIVFFVFDLLYYHGHDLRQSP